jgi:hypothetical protein
MGVLVSQPLEEIEYLFQNEEGKEDGPNGKSETWENQSNCFTLDPGESGVASYAWKRMGRGLCPVSC